MLGNGHIYKVFRQYELLNEFSNLPFLKIPSHKSYIWQSLDLFYKTGKMKNLSIQ